MAIDKLGEKEYKKLLQEVDLMTHTPIDIKKIIDKRLKEIEECLAAERQLEEPEEERRVTRSQAGKPGSSADPEPAPVPVGSPKKRKAEDETRKEVGGKKPKTSDRKETGGKMPKSSERKETGGKMPKASE